MLNVGMEVGFSSRQQMYSSHCTVRSRFQVERRLQFGAGLHGPVELLPEACGNFHGELQTAIGSRPRLHRGREVHHRILKTFSMDVVREVRSPTAEVRLVRSVMHRMPCFRLRNPC